MHGIKPTFALTASLALLFAGCEWSGTSDSNAWSNAYDAMNFSGSYRTVTSATSSTASTSTTTSESKTYAVHDEKVGQTAKDVYAYSGTVSHANLVAGSVIISVGQYSFVDNGSGSLVCNATGGAGSIAYSSGAWSITLPSGASSFIADESTATPITQTDTFGKTTTNLKYSYKLSHDKLVAGSVTVSIGGTTAFQDDGSGHLVGANGNTNGSGTVNYSAGVVSFVLKVPDSGKDVKVVYQYTTTSGSSTTPSSGGIAAGQSIVASYSFVENSTTGGVSNDAVATSTGTKVTAISVSQSGQNLSMHFNNGIVMSGRFTGVRQTGKINQDTSTGYNTYNAQFEVASGSESKMVGTLNYDLQLGVRTLNGTWTWGRNTYDVQAVGPAWLNSADTSTLQYEVVTGSK